MLYTYKCKECEKHFQINKRMSDPPPSKCPMCDSEDIHRVYDVPSIVYKGSGFYNTDKALDTIVPEYDLTDAQQAEYFDEKLRHGDDKKIRVFT